VKLRQTVDCCAVISEGPGWGCFSEHGENIMNACYNASLPANSTGVTPHMYVSGASNTDSCRQVMRFCCKMRAHFVCLLCWEAVILTHNIHVSTFENFVFQFYCFIFLICWKLSCCRPPLYSCCDHPDYPPLCDGVMINRVRNALMQNANTAPWIAIANEVLEITVTSEMSSLSQSVGLLFECLHFV